MLCVRRESRDLLDDPQKTIDGRTDSGADVEDLVRGWSLRSTDDCLHHVLDEHVVSFRPTATESHHPAGQMRREDVGNHVPIRIVRPEYVEQSERDASNVTPLFMEQFEQMLALDLAFSVNVVRPDQSDLGERLVRESIHSSRRCEDDAAD